MTPAQHTTEAAALLVATTSAADENTRIRNARIAQVHAILGRAAGTGTAYTDAEAALALCATAPWSFGSAIAQAHASALLATL